MVEAWGDGPIHNGVIAHKAPESLNQGPKLGDMVVDAEEFYRKMVRTCPPSQMDVDMACVCAEKKPIKLAQEYLTMNGLEAMDSVEDMPTYIPTSSSASANCSSALSTAYSSKMAPDKTGVAHASFATAADRCAQYRYQQSMEHWGPLESSPHKQGIIDEHGYKSPLSAGVDDGHRSHQVIDAYAELTGDRIGPGPRVGSPSYAHHESIDPLAQEYPERYTPAYVSLSQEEERMNKFILGAHSLVRKSNILDPSSPYPPARVGSFEAALMEKERELKEAREEIEKLKRAREEWGSTVGEREGKGGSPEASLLMAAKLGWVPRETVNKFIESTQQHIDVLAQRFEQHLSFCQREHMSQLQKQGSKEVIVKEHKKGEKEETTTATTKETPAKPATPATPATPETPETPASGVTKRERTREKQSSTLTSHTHASSKRAQPGGAAGPVPATFYRYSMSPRAPIPIFSPLKPKLERLKERQHESSSSNLKVIKEKPSTRRHVKKERDKDGSRKDGVVEREVNDGEQGTSQSSEHEEAHRQEGGVLVGVTGDGQEEAPNNDDTSLEKQSSRSIQKTQEPPTSLRVVEPAEDRIASRVPERVLEICIASASLLESEQTRGKIDEEPWGLSVSETRSPSEDVEKKSMSGEEKHSAAVLGGTETDSIKYWEEFHVLESPQKMKEELSSETAEETAAEEVTVAEEAGAEKETAEKCQVQLEQLSGIMISNESDKGEDKTTKFFDLLFNPHSDEEKKKSEDIWKILNDVYITKENIDEKFESLRSFETDDVGIKMILDILKDDGSSKTNEDHVKDIPETKMKPGKPMRKMMSHPGWSSILSSLIADPMSWKPKRQSARGSATRRNNFDSVGEYATSSKTRRCRRSGSVGDTPSIGKGSRVTKGKERTVAHASFGCQPSSRVPDLPNESGQKVQDQRTAGSSSSGGRTVRFDRELRENIQERSGASFPASTPRQVKKIPTMTPRSPGLYISKSLSSLQEEKPRGIMPPSLAGRIMENRKERRISATDTACPEQSDEVQTPGAVKDPHDAPAQLVISKNKRYSLSVSHTAERKICQNQKLWRH